MTSKLEDLQDSFSRIPTLTSSKIYCDDIPRKLKNEFLQILRMWASEKFCSDVRSKITILLDNPTLVFYFAKKT